MKFIKIDTWIKSSLIKNITQKVRANCGVLSVYLKVGQKQLLSSWGLEGTATHRAPRCCAAWRGRGAVWCGVAWDTRSIWGQRPGYRRANNQGDRKQFPGSHGTACVYAKNWGTAATVISTGPRATGYYCPVQREATQSAGSIKPLSHEVKHE